MPGILTRLRREPFTRPFAGGRHPLDPPDDDLISQLPLILRREGAISLPPELANPSVLSREEPPQMSPPLLTRDPITRPRLVQPEPVVPFPPPLTRRRSVPLSGTGYDYTAMPPVSDVEPLTRERRTQPRDYLADDQAYLEGLEAGGKPIKPLVRKPGKLETVLGFASSFLDRGLFGAADYGIRRFNPSTWQNAEIDATKERMGQEILTRKSQSDLLGDATDRRYKEAQTNYLLQRPDIEANKLTQRQADQQRSTLARIYNDLPEFDPASPANAALVEAMTAAGLPVVPKSRGKQIQFIQDAQTGRWTVIGADKGSAAPMSATVPTQTGSPLTTTPQVQVLTRSRRAIADADRQSRERIGAANRASREGIATQNRQSRENLKRSTLTEQQVRDAAKAKGLDENKAVERARSRGMIR